uniref:VAP27 n=1 Tax=Solanum tuberosum TaxID=4113 RepID=M1BE65_SOLTU
MRTYIDRIPPRLLLCSRLKRLKLGFFAAYIIEIFPSVRFQISAFVSNELSCCALYHLEILRTKFGYIYSAIFGYYSPNLPQTPPLHAVALEVEHIYVNQFQLAVLYVVLRLLIEYLEINVLCSSSRAASKTLKQEFILALHHWWFLFLRLHCNYDIVGRVRHDNSSVGLTLFHWICCLHLESNIIIGIVIPDIIVAL